MHQLILYETLLFTSQAQTLLSYQPFFKPLLELLKDFGRDANSNKTGSKVQRGQSSKETEEHLVIVAQQLCKMLRENVELLDYFYRCPDELESDEVKENSNEESEFILLSVLVSFVHREGKTGQYARDALVHCMALSRKNEAVGSYIAKNSNFCTVSFC